MTKSY